MTKCAGQDAFLQSVEDALNCFDEKFRKEALLLTNMPINLKGAGEKDVRQKLAQLQR